MLSEKDFISTSGEEVMKRAVQLIKQMKRPKAILVKRSFDPGLLFD